MKIISIKQPWAALIVHGLKDIENRTWRTKYRGPVLVHASQKPDSDADAPFIEQWYGIRLPREQPDGGVVGVVEIVDCVNEHPSPWFNHGGWGFVLKNARRLPFTPWKGALSITDAPAALLRKLKL